MIQEKGGRKKNRKLIIAAALMTVVLSGCGNGGKEEASKQAVMFTDALGNEVTVDKPEKTAALMGSFAEAWLLSGGSLAALTQDAYDERGIQPDVSVANLGAMKSPDIELMIQEGIDFAILSSNIAEHVKLRDTLENSGITTAYFSVENFEEYLAMLDILTEITGNKELYQKNGLEVQEQIHQAIAAGEGKEAPSVLLIRAYSTGAKVKGSGNMAGAMLKDMGCVNLADTHESLLEELSIEEIILADPDFIFVTTMGPSNEAAMGLLEESLQSNPAWGELSAVKNGRYIVLPRSLFHYKPNSRWGESYEMLAEILYGEP